MSYNVEHCKVTAEVNVVTNPGDWISEAKLWVNWLHVGQMDARTPTELLTGAKAHYEVIPDMAGLGSFSAP